MVIDCQIIADQTPSSVISVTTPHCQVTANSIQLYQQMFGGNFLKHCFVILTFPTKNTTLEKKLVEEKDNPFGELINEQLEKKVVAVDNSADNVYLRRRLQEQVLFMVANKLQSTYTNESIKEVRYFNIKVQLLRTLILRTNLKKYDFGYTYRVLQNNILHISWKALKIN